MGPLSARQQQNITKALHLLSHKQTTGRAALGEVCPRLSTWSTRLCVQAQADHRAQLHGAQQLSGSMGSPHLQADISGGPWGCVTELPFSDTPWPSIADAGRISIRRNLSRRHDILLTLDAAQGRE